ncbi:hypothetical protein [Brevibacillus laterosporus]|uniref:hypothetical protein n=1 Tax=Brevibacillus laterosporus TaxID=1465 RepID=UPI000CE2E06C|nr:hypothetical protein [Brevibacillus laterosporus]MED1666961.1 hypothetical protein [Brevibacillus laterosporus]MED1667895.1 hypothetical protein [Brevibacillus laterosporus]MED1716813.1 hypothetical protein [Brevibacillus laterosporus]PPA89910.1 hypothetical protein C4A76_00055 [Brevibacillus laterosporus]
MMRRWIDIDPLDWFYRDLLEATRLHLDGEGTQSFIDGMYYDAFEKGYERMVKRFVTVDGQQEFLVPDYKVHDDNPIFVIVNGVEVQPEKVENGKITMSNPMSGGIEVVCIAFGKPRYQQVGCVNTPFSTCGENDVHMPSADVMNKSQYTFSLRLKPEACTVLGVKLKRKLVDIQSGDNPEQKIKEAIGFNRDVFVIHAGRVYLPYMYNGYPAKVTYNYKIGGNFKTTTDTVIVKSSCVRYNDRFFPKVQLRRSEFMVFLQRMRRSFYNRFTDKEYKSNPSPTRYITDQDTFSGKWYATDVIDILEERFLDGCYAFPLYEDERFEPEECITRAEAIVFLNRFIEWAIERFR